MRAHQARGSRNGRSIIKAAEQLDLHANHTAAAGDDDAPGVATVAQRRHRTAGGENRRFCTRCHLKDSKPQTVTLRPLSPSRRAKKKEIESGAVAHASGQGYQSERWEHGVAVQGASARERDRHGSQANGNRRGLASPQLRSQIYARADIILICFI
jgi:hypothetical protein